MISTGKHTFFLDTANTSYWIRVNHAGLLETLYYGRRLKNTDRVGALRDKHFIPLHDSIAYSRQYPTMNLNNICLETSAPECGDFRESALVVEYGRRGTCALNMLYKGHRIIKGKPRAVSGLPEAYGKENECSTIEFTLVDEAFPFALILSYTVFEESDVITKKAVFVNNSPDPVKVRSIASAQLDLFDDNWNLVSFDGTWAGERQVSERRVQNGITIIDSKSGVSSAKHNPMICLKRPDCTDDNGECYAMNLIYSGNHREVIERSEFGKVRLLTGINPQTFTWTLEPGRRFHTPEAVLTFSYEGTNGLSANLHRFINLHIVRGSWKLRQRPVLLNSWEACYFNFDQTKLENLAVQAAKLGIELFVLDDGWFAGRNDDSTSLGDWYPDTGKLPEGLRALSRKIHQLDMLFGLWVEPEMISHQSKLFEQHPQWRMEIPQRLPRTGRNQYILNLTLPEVQRYLITTMVNLFREAEVDYVKWDMNRVFTDIHSPLCDHGEVAHRYCLGLYEVLRKVTENCPDILFESCASGGNRFDLGMLCYMPQAWCSDNTDAYSRTLIQGGTAWGYPLSATGAHVSDSPNHQTLRVSDIESRFNVAAFGVLGYEMDITKLTAAEKVQVAGQIAFYKENRSLLQFGRYYRLQSDENRTIWAVTDSGRSRIIVLDFQVHNVPDSPARVLRIPFADPEFLYKVTPRQQKLNLRKLGLPVETVTTLELPTDGTPAKALSDRVFLNTEVEHYIVPGDMLAWGGIKLFQQYNGGIYNGHSRVMPDFSSRIYVIERTGTEDKPEK